MRRLQALNFNTNSSQWELVNDFEKEINRYETLYSPKKRIRDLSALEIDSLLRLSETLV